MSMCVFVDVSAIEFDSARKEKANSRLLRGVRGSILSDPPYK